MDDELFDTYSYTKMRGKQYVMDRSGAKTPAVKKKRKRKEK
jgi:hypothetical protein